MKKTLTRLGFAGMAAFGAMTMGCGGVEDEGAPPEQVGFAQAAVVPGYDLSGAWGTASISQSGSNLAVYIPGRPSAYGFYTGSTTIYVSFTDDPGCCTGIIGDNGNRIAWSNGTTWTR